jgi:hypothetical protein
VQQAITDCDRVGNSGDDHAARLADKRSTAAARSFLFGALACCPLLWVALLNGYPTVYPDTSNYIYAGAFGIALPPFRSPGYGVFLELTSLGVSTWFTIVAQAIIVVAVLYESCKFLIGGDSRFRDHCLLVIAAILAMLTSLPWETSLLMPDVFAGVVFLSLFLLAFNAELKWIERILLAGISAVGIGAHASLLPIAAVLVAALAVSRVISGVVRRPSRGVPSATSIVVWLVVPLLAAGVWTASLNRKMGLGFRVSASGTEFLLGRLLADGLAADFLRETCPKKPLVSCRYLENLPKTTEQFLFWHPLLHEMDANGDEMREIVRGTLVRYPLRFVRDSVKQTLRQLVTLRTGDEVRDLALKAPNTNAEVIAQVFPRDLPAYSASRLIQGRLIRLTYHVAGIDAAVFWLSLVACIAIAWTRRDQRWNRFFHSAIGFLFINAAICATLAGVYDRYQSRVAWIVPLCLAIFVCDLVKSRNYAGIFNNLRAVSLRISSRSESVNQGASNTRSTGFVSQVKG